MSRDAELIALYAGRDRALRWVTKIQYSSRAASATGPIADLGIIDFGLQHISSNSKTYEMRVRVRILMLPQILQPQIDIPNSSIAEKIGTVRRSRGVEQCFHARKESSTRGQGTQGSAHRRADRGTHPAPPARGPPRQRLPAKTQHRGERRELEHVAVARRGTSPRANAHAASPPPIAPPCAAAGSLGCLHRPRRNRPAQHPLRVVGDGCAAPARPKHKQQRVSVLAGRTLNAAGQARVTLSLRQERLSAACWPRQEERGLIGHPGRRGASAAVGASLATAVTAPRRDMRL